MNFFILSACVQHFFTKLIYNKVPEAGAMQVLFLRAIVSTMISFALMNVHFVQIMFTSIPRSSYSNLAVRCAQGLVSFYFIYYALRYLPLVFVSLVMNLSPITTAIMSYCILGEKLSKLDIGILIVCLGGMIVLIMGS